MESKDIRRKNARELAEQVGGITAFAEKINKQQNYASAIIGKNPTKNIGPTIARAIEKAFNKPIGWLDQLHYKTYTAEAVGRSKIEGKVPLIELDQALQFMQNPSHEGHDMVHTSRPQTEKLFAIHLQKTGNAVIDLPGLSYAVIEPSAEYKHDDYVLAQLDKNDRPAVYIYKIEDDREFFCPLNLSCKIEVMIEPLILGVVTEIRIIPNESSDQNQ